MARVERRTSAQPTRRQEQVVEAESWSGYGGPRRRRGDGASAPGPDDALREEVEEHLSHHPDIDASDIEVLVESGEVTLQGTVEDRDMRWIAESVAESVSGVSLVHNRLRLARH